MVAVNGFCCPMGKKLYSMMVSLCCAHFKAAEDYTLYAGTTQKSMEITPAESRFGSQLNVVVEKCLIQPPFCQTVEQV